MSERLSGTILYGMMGSGKTTLGKGLAEHLGQNFVDTDELVEQRSGLSCMELVAAGMFVEHQIKAILDYSPSEPEVVATGGSVATNVELVKHLGQFGVGILIDVEPYALEDRLSEERISALNNPKGLSFSELYEERSRLYTAAADYTLYVPGDEPEEITLSNLIDMHQEIAQDAVRV